MVLVNRLQFGFYPCSRGFDVEVDYAAVERAFFLDTDWGPSLSASG